MTQSQERRVSAVDAPIVEILAPASHDAYEPPQADEIVLVDKMMMWTEANAIT